MQVGNKVIVSSCISTTREYLKEITGETPKYWKVNKDYFNKNNLRLKGENNAWCFTKIRLATAEDFKKIKRNKLLGKVNNIDIESLTIEQLQQIIDITEEK